MRGIVSRGAESRGGIHGYPLKSLFQEVAFVAYHFHWAQESVMNLEHTERRRWVDEISSINRRMNAAEGEPFV